MRRAVFLDRDGVLNRPVVRDGRPYAPSGVADLEILPGVVNACTRLKNAGFLLIVVTNQPDVVRGTLTRDVVDAINWTLRSQIPLDDIRVCYHDDPDECACRKPKPGLLLQAARDWQIDLENSFLVGDRWKDIEAGRRAGCATVLIDYSYPESQQCIPDYRSASLPDAAEWVIRQAGTLRQEWKT